MFSIMHKNKVSISIISDEKEILRSAASSPVANTALLFNMTTSEHQSNKVKKYIGYFFYVLYSKVSN